MGSLAPPDARGEQGLVLPKTEISSGLFLSTPT